MLSHKRQIESELYFVLQKTFQSYIGFRSLIQFFFPYPFQSSDLLFMEIPIPNCTCFRFFYQTSNLFFLIGTIGTIGTGFPLYCLLFQYSYSENIKYPNFLVSKFPNFFLAISSLLVYSTTIPMICQQQTQIAHLLGTSVLFSFFPPIFIHSRSPANQLILFLARVSFNTICRRLPHTVM